METWDLIPDRALDRTPRSEWWLRGEAEAALFPVSHAQFRDYRDAGLIPPPDENGKYPAWVAQALIGIRQTGLTVRPLPRRVVLLRGNWILYRIPIEAVRSAMLDVLPTIRRPVRKLATMAAVTGMRGRGRALPRPKQWPEILTSVPPDRLDALLPSWYAMVNQVLPARSSPESLATIPHEEQVILYGLLSLTQAPLTRHGSLGPAESSAT